MLNSIRSSKEEIAKLFSYLRELDANEEYVGLVKKHSERMPWRYGNKCRLFKKDIVLTHGSEFLKELVIKIYDLAIRNFCADNINSRAVSSACIRMYLIDNHQLLDDLSAKGDFKVRVRQALSGEQLMVVHTQSIELVLV